MKPGLPFFHTPHRALPLLWALGSCGPSPAAESTFSLTVATDSVGKRAISLTDGAPSIQPEFSVSFANGVYAGAWATNVDSDAVSAEIDLYAGYRATVAEGLTLGVGAFHFENVGDAAQNFQEYFIDAGYGGFVNARYRYSPDFSGTGHPSRFLELGYAHPIGESTGIAIDLGRMAFADGTPLKDYTIFQLTISRSFGASRLFATYSDTTSKQFGGRADGRLFAGYTITW